MADTRLRWGILGPGNIAREFLLGARGSATGRVTALGTRDPDRPGLADQFPGLRIHAGYAALLADPEIDAIYIATPHPFHAEWAIAAARHGKHVLCEKPAGMNAAEVKAMFAAAAEHGTFLAEAYMYRLHPLTFFLLDLLRKGKVGEVRMIKSSFGFAVAGASPNHRLFSRALGGGAILDVGGYPMSMARLIAGYRDPQGIAEPAELKAFLDKGPTGVDEIASALVAFPNGILAELSCSITLWQDNVLHILGTEGRLEVDDFWFGSGKHGGTAKLRFTPPGGATEIIPFEEGASVYSFQFEAANRAIRAGEGGFDWPGMTRRDSIGNAEALDRWLREVSLVEPPLASASATMS